MTKQQFIALYWYDAVEACKGKSIFPLMAIAESALESAWGESWLTRQAFNFLGTKSTASWEAAGGKFIIKPTREVVDGKDVIIQAKFRRYDSPQQCFENYVHFVTQPNYVAHGVLTAATPEDQIRCIAAAGYATDPHYAAAIIEVMHGLVPLLPA